MVIHVMQHVAVESTVESIKKVGLIANDPSERWPGDDGNPIGVYLSRGRNSPYVPHYLGALGEKLGIDNFKVLEINIAGLEIKIDPLSEFCSYCGEDIRVFCDCSEMFGTPWHKELYYCPHNISPDRILN